MSPNRITMTVQTLQFTEFASPLGQLLLIVRDERLCALDYSGYDERMHKLLRARFGDYKLETANAPFGLCTRLHAYFAGDLAAIDEVAVDSGGTPFQQAVWAMLRMIPAGSTATYGELARRLGKANAARAVGITNSLNPIAIVVPCHRVIGADGKLTGYAGGLERKRWLLKHEGVRLVKSTSFEPLQPSLFRDIS